MTFIIFMIEKMVCYNQICKVTFICAYFTFWTRTANMGMTVEVFSACENLVKFNFKLVWMQTGTQKLANSAFCLIDFA